MGLILDLNTFGFGPKSQKLIGSLPLHKMKTTKLTKKELKPKK